MINETYKSIDLEISYTKHSKNCEISVKRQAGIHFGTETTFSELTGFLEDAQRVLHGYRHCSENGLYCEVYLSVSTYQRGPCAEDLKQLSFQGWQFKDIVESDCEGLYLAPDTRYTDETHDIWIDFSEPFLSQLAQANI